MPKGGKREGAGRPKGSIDKNNKLLREMILQALDEQAGGGVGYLKVQAVAEPKAFMALLGRVLPLQLTGENGTPIQTVTRIELGVLGGDSKD